MVAQTTVSYHRSSGGRCFQDTRAAPEGEPSMDQPVSLIQLFESQDDGWITVEGQAPIEVRLTMKGAYAQHFKWEDRDGRRLKRPSGREIVDIEGYFQTTDARAHTIFEGPERALQLEFLFFEDMAREWITVRRTRKAGVFGLRSSV